MRPRSLVSQCVSNSLCVVWEDTGRIACSAGGRQVCVKRWWSRGFRSSCAWRAMLITLLTSCPTTPPCPPPLLLPPISPTPFHFSCSTTTTAPGCPNPQRPQADVCGCRRFLHRRRHHQHPHRAEASAGPILCATQPGSGCFGDQRCLRCLHGHQQQPQVGGFDRWLSNCWLCNVVTTLEHQHITAYISLRSCVAWSPVAARPAPIDAPHCANHLSSSHSRLLPCAGLCHSHSPTHSLTHTQHKTQNTGTSCLLV